MFSQLENMYACIAKEPEETLKKKCFEGFDEAV